MQLQIIGSICAGLVTVSILGCGESVETPDTFPVSGAVTYNGDPVVGARVAFQAEGAPRVAEGVTNAEGKFQLTTFELNDGAVPGEHKITVTKVEGESQPAGDMEAMLEDPNAMAQMGGEDQDANKDGKSAGPKNLLPEKYSNFNSTPLKETVAEEKNNFNLLLAD